MSHESHIAQESQTLMIILNVPHLNVGEVEAGCPEPLLVPGLHLGDAAVVGGRVQEVRGAVRGVVIIPDEDRGVTEIHNEIYGMAWYGMVLYGMVWWLR